jgi:small-conductance mechanosensitive channel
MLRSDDARRQGSVAAASRLLHYLVLAIGVGIGLQIAGINMTALFAAGALVAVGIGFALQTISENFFSGLILLLERTIKPGDVLQINDQMVRVVEMGIRSTVVRTFADEDLIVPNSVLVKDTVKNYTLRDNLHRVRAIVGVSYGSDMKLVRQVLEQVIADIPWKTDKVKPSVLMREFGDSSVIFSASVWVDDPWSSFQRSSQLHEAIWWALKEANITIAFPQIDVHLDTVASDSVQRIEPGA